MRAAPERLCFNFCSFFLKEFVSVLCWAVLCVVRHAVCITTVEPPHLLTAGQLSGRKCCTRAMKKMFRSVWVAAAGGHGRCCRCTQITPAAVRPWPLTCCVASFLRPLICWPLTVQPNVNFLFCVPARFRAPPCARRRPRHQARSGKQEVDPDET